MKRYLAIYLGSANGENMAKWSALDEKTRKEKEKTAIIAWQNWVKEHKSSFIDTGAPLGKTKRAGRKGISDVKNLMTAYTVVEAESHEEAAKLFLNHPHFTQFPGEAIEIMECLPIPGM